MSLSDLDLVQQAMAPTEPGAQPAQAAAAAGANGAGTGTGTGTGTSDAAAAAAAAADDPLAGIDLSQLNDADRAALQPILDALRAASGAEGRDGGDLDYEGILTQLDAAGDVADTLEGRLDRLLADLGELEKEEQDQAQAQADTDADK